MTDGNNGLLHVRLPEALRARVKACARLDAATVPEFTRGALRSACESVERRVAQRERARKAAAQG